MIASPTRTIARSRVTTAVVLGVAMALLPTLAAAPAHAATVTVINTDGQGVASRHAPSQSATNGYGAPAGASVSTICWTTGDPVGPNANRLWWLISYAGREFYAADRYLSTPYVAGSTPSEPQCGRSAPPYVDAWYSSGANLRGCANATTCAVMGWLPDETAVNPICWWDGASATGNYASQRWFKIAYSGGNALIHSSLVERQTNVRMCFTAWANDGWDVP